MSSPRIAPRGWGPRGFTLVELLVTLGIIALLLSLLLPALGAARASARRIKCAEQVRGYGTAMNLYANDHNGYMVPLEQWPPTKVETWAEPVFGSALVWDNAAQMEYSWLLVCPSDPYGGNPDPGRPSRNSYLINSLLPGWRIKHNGPYFGGTPSDIVVLGEKRPDAVGWCEGFCYSLSTPDPRWYDEIDLVRHGKQRRSNHLFLDLHVDNRDLSERGSRLYSPWLIRGQ